MNKISTLGVLMIAMLIIPSVYSIVIEPNLDVDSCLVKNSNEFRFKIEGKDLDGQWKLFRLGSSDNIDIGLVHVGETIGSFGKDTITTSLEGSWVKKYWDNSEWIQKGDADNISVVGYTEYGNICPEAEIPEFGVLAAFTALIGAIGIMIQARNR